MAPVCPVAALLGYVGCGMSTRMIRGSGCGRASLRHFSRHPLLLPLAIFELAPMFKIAHS